MKVTDPIMFEIFCVGAKGLLISVSARTIVYEWLTGYLQMQPVFRLDLTGASEQDRLLGLRAGDRLSFVCMTPGLEILSFC